MSSRREFIRQAAAAGLFPVIASSASAATAPETPRSVGAPLRLAIVGTGQISLRYLKPGSTNPRWKFVATCARTLESARSRAVEFGIDTWFDDYQKMYDTAKPDAVVIATPTTLHAEQTIAALERGIHVLCEKPMAARFEDCQAMVAASEKNGAVLLALPYNASPAFRAALEHLNEATLGVFTGAEATLSLPGVSRDNWYYDVKVAGGGAALDTLVYPVSKLIELLGPARRVTGFINTLIPQRILGDGATIDALPPPRDPAKAQTVVRPTVDDNSTVLIEWGNGQQAMARALWGTSFVNNILTVYGRHGTLWSAVFGGELIIHSPERAIPSAESISWNGQKACYKVALPPAGKDEGLLDHFVDCIEGKAKPSCGGHQALHVHEILFKAYEAARTGRAQELQTTFTPWHPIDPKFMDTRSGPI